MTHDEAVLLCRYLTPRELKVFQVYADGFTAAQVASRLGCSKRTVERHIANVYAALGVHNRIEAVRVAALAGIIRP